MKTIDILYNQLERLRKIREKQTDVIIDKRLLVLINGIHDAISTRERFKKLRRFQIQNN